MSRKVKFQFNPLTMEPRAVPVESNAPRERVQALCLLEMFGGRIDSAAAVPDEDDDGDG